MVARRKPVDQSLEAIAERLAVTLFDDETQPAARAAVARELRMVLQDIEAAKAGKQGDTIDELAARRRTRRARTG